MYIFPITFVITIFSFLVSRFLVFFFSFFHFRLHPTTSFSQVARLE